MNKYNSFVEFARAQIRNLSEIQENTVVREAAIIVAGAIKQRVENSGRDSNNATIQSKSKERFGAYSKAWGEQRQSKGRQTGIVDLNYTGNMWSDWRPVPAPDGWGATFVTRESMEKARKNQLIFRTAIFAPTENEIKIGNNAINQRVRKLLKRK